MKRIICLSLLVTSLAMAADLPGGLIRTADNSINKFEMVLSPSVDLSPGGAFLSSEFRYQATEDVGLGLGFGAGELGFNFGANAIWYISPDLPSQPAFAILGGVYFNQLSSLDYLLLRVTPIVSKSVKTQWGSVSPYAGLQLAPSVGFGMANSDFGIRASMGAQFTFTSLHGVQLWSEFGLGLFHSNHEIVIGMSYPFSAAGG